MLFSSQWRRKKIVIIIINPSIISIKHLQDFKFKFKVQSTAMACQWQLTQSWAGNAIWYQIMHHLIFMASSLWVSELFLSLKKNRQLLIHLLFRANKFKTYKQKSNLKTATNTNINTWDNTKTWWNVDRNRSLITIGYLLFSRSIRSLLNLLIFSRLIFLLLFFVTPLCPRNFLFPISGSALTIFDHNPQQMHMVLAVVCLNLTDIFDICFIWNTFLGIFIFIKQ